MAQSKHKGSKKRVGDILRRKRVKQAAGAYNDITSIMIAKELVLLDDTTISQNSLYDRVKFTDNYIPAAGHAVNDTTRLDLDECKKIFRQVFAGETHLNVNYPYLPCGNVDNGVSSSVISYGLRNRFTTLAQEIILMESTQKDTAALRTKLGQLDALRELINAIAVSPRCHDYVNNTQSDKVAENLESAQWESMLRAFAAVYLIAKDKAGVAIPGDIKFDKGTAASIIDQLSSHQITEDQLKAFETTWDKGKGNTSVNLKELLECLNKPTAAAAAAAAAGAPTSTGCAEPAKLNEDSALELAIEDIQKHMLHHVVAIRNLYEINAHITQLTTAIAAAGGDQIKIDALTPIKTKAETDKVGAEEIIKQLRDEIRPPLVSSYETIMGDYANAIELMLKEAKIRLEQKNHELERIGTSIAETSSAIETAEALVKRQKEAVDAAQDASYKKPDSADDAEKLYTAQGELQRQNDVILELNLTAEKVRNKQQDAFDAVAAAESTVEAISEIDQEFKKIGPNYDTFTIAYNKAIEEEVNAKSSMVGDSVDLAAAKKHIDLMQTHATIIRKGGFILENTKERLHQSITYTWHREKARELSAKEKALTEGKEKTATELIEAQGEYAAAIETKGKISIIQSLRFGTKSIDAEIDSAQKKINTLREVLGVFDTQSEQRVSVQGAYRDEKAAKQACSEAINDDSPIGPAVAGAASAAASRRTSLAGLYTSIIDQSGIKVAAAKVASDKADAAQAAAAAETSATRAEQLAKQAEDAIADLRGQAATAQFDLGANNGILDTALAAARAAAAAARAAADEASAAGGDLKRATAAAASAAKGEADARKEKAEIDRIVSETRAAIVTAAADAAAAAAAGVAAAEAGQKAVAAKAEIDALVAQLRGVKGQIDGYTARLTGSIPNIAEPAKGIASAAQATATAAAGAADAAAGAAEAASDDEIKTGTVKTTIQQAIAVAEGAAADARAAADAAEAARAAAAAQAAALAEQQRLAAAAQAAAAAATPPPTAPPPPPTGTPPRRIRQPPLGLLATQGQRAATPPTTPPTTPPPAQQTQLNEGKVPFTLDQKTMNEIKADLNRVPNLPAPTGGGGGSKLLYNYKQVTGNDAKKRSVFTSQNPGLVQILFSTAAGVADHVQTTNDKPINETNKFNDLVGAAKAMITAKVNKQNSLSSEFRRDYLAALLPIVEEEIKKNTKNAKPAVNLFGQGGGGDTPDDLDVTTRDPESTETYQELAEKVTGKLKTSLDTCTEDLSRCDQEKEKNRKAIEQLTATVATLQADLRTQISTAAKGSQDLTAKLAELDSAKSSDTESTKALTDATEQYKTLIAESQAKLAETDTQLKETRAKIEGLVAEVEASDKKAQENEALIAELKGVIAKLQPQQPQAGGGLPETHPLLELAAAISAATATLLPK